MLNKFFYIVFPNSESSFIYYILPIIFSIVGILIIWVIFLSVAGFIKVKSEKWKQPQYRKSYTRNFVLIHKSLILKTLTAARRVTSLYILFMLISQILETFDTALSESSHNSIRVWSTSANYTLALSKFFDRLAHSMMNIFLIVVVSIWFMRVIQKALDIVMHKSGKNKNNFESERDLAKRNTLNSVTSHLLKIIISIIAVFTILENLGINIAALLATAGVASVAVGFGAQNLIKDFIAGFFILFEDQFTIGDSVDLMTISGIISGSVEKMTLRMSRIRSNEGSLLTIPNGDIRSVKNYSTDWARIDFKYGLELRANLEKASLIFREQVELLCKDFAHEIIGTPDIRPMEKIIDFENKSTSVSFRAFIKTTTMATKVKVETELNKRLIAHFKKEDVYMLNPR